MGMIELPNLIEQPCPPLSPLHVCTWVHCLRAPVSHRSLGSPPLSCLIRYSHTHAFLHYHQKKEKNGLNKPPHNRGKTTVPVSCLFRVKTTTHFTPFKWWFVSCLDDTSIRAQYLLAIIVVPPHEEKNL